MKYIGIWDFIWVPVYLFLVHYFANRGTRNNIEENPAYKYYRPGLLAKVYGGLLFAFIYMFYYGGGDTTAYWLDAKILSTLITSEPVCYLRILFGDTSHKWLYCFDLRDNIPYYYLRDHQAYTVTRISSPFATLSVDSFLGCTILVSWFSFGGVWRLYLVFLEEYPSLRKELAIAFLFIPSVVFWGSGVMKDTYTFTALCWMTSSVYGLLFKKRKVFWNLFYMAFAAYVMIAMKPYIFVALLPGLSLWLVFNRIQKVQNQIVRVMAAPIILMLGVVGATLIFSSASESLGAYGSVDTIVDKAIATQEDLQREAYQGNSFDIGTIDPSIGGMLTKAPVAIFAGLFRPTFLDVRNPVMFISALENTILMLFLLYMLFKIGPLAFARYVFGKPMVLFSFTFAIIFSFAVGLTTANFGALVRYKIPALPFFLASLYMIRYHQNRKGFEDEEESESDLLKVEDFSGSKEIRPPFIPKPDGQPGEYR
ncbi:MAG: hypothetical protein K9J17_04480 [Flavobacteriales bacterium]|nr:hypothetical protein [Flavobacteriales bacterium]